MKIEINNAVESIVETVVENEKNAKVDLPVEWIGRQVQVTLLEEIEEEIIDFEIKSNLHDFAFNGELSVINNEFAITYFKNDGSKVFELKDLINHSNENDNILIEAIENKYEEILQSIYKKVNKEFDEFNLIIK